MSTFPPEIAPPPALELPPGEPPRPVSESLELEFPGPHWLLKKGLPMGCETERRWPLVARALALGAAALAASAMFSVVEVPAVVEAGTCALIACETPGSTGAPTCGGAVVAISVEGWKDALGEDSALSPLRTIC